MSKSYWYKLYDSNTRVNAIRNGVEPKPIKLYAETPEIVASFQEPTNPNGWNRLGMDEKFNSLEEAEAFFYGNEKAFIEYMDNKYGKK